MKKFRSILAIAVIAAMCLALCACSGLTDLLSSTTYNTGDLKDGYTNVSSIDGVKFAVPSDLKEEALGDMEFMELMFGAMDNEEDLKKLQNTTFELRDETTYALLNYSKTFITVAPAELSESLDKVEDQKDLADALKIDDEGINLKIGNSYLKSTLNGVIKMICPIECDFDEEMGANEDAIYSGYIAVVENENEDVYILLAVSQKDADDEMKYIAKSLEYTGEDIAKKDDDSEDDDEDLEDWKDDVELPEWEDGDPIVDGDSDDNHNNIDDEKENNETPEQKPSSPTDFDADLKDFEISINGQVIEIPMNLNDFLQKFNLKLNDNDAKVQLKNNQYTFVSAKGANSEYVSLRVINVSGEDNPSIYDCDIFSVSADKYTIYGYGEDTTKPRMDIVLPCGIKIYESTYEDVIREYGEPDEIRDNPESDYIYLTWDLSSRKYDYYTNMEITIEREKNLVSEFDYGKMPI